MKNLLFCFLVFFACAHLDAYESILYRRENVHLVMPSCPLTKQAIGVQAEKKYFLDWDERELAESYDLMQKVVRLLAEEQNAPSYLIYGYESQESEKPFQFQIVPFNRTTSKIYAFYQQFQVLLATTNKEEDPLINDALISKYQKLQSDFCDKQLSFENVVGDDVFCNEDVIEKQRIFEGKTIEVLYDYAPICEKHFLFVTKRHCARFDELTEEEHREALLLAQQIATEFQEEGCKVYLFHKTGKEAGQSVPHWHLHLIITDSASENFFGKLTILKNMLIGSSPLSEKELQKRVSAYKIPG